MLLHIKVAFLDGQPLLIGTLYAEFLIYKQRCDYDTLCHNLPFKEAGLTLTIAKENKRETQGDMLISLQL